MNLSACGNSAFPRTLPAGRYPSHWIGGYHTHRNLGPPAQVVFLEAAAEHLEAAAILEVGVKGKKSGLLTRTISTTKSRVRSGWMTMFEDMNSSTLSGETRKINCLYFPRRVYALAGPV